MKSIISIFNFIDRVKKNFNILSFIFAHLAFYVLIGHQYIWSQDFLKLWYLMLVLFCPVGIIILSSLRNEIKKETLLWVSIPAGSAFFMIILAFWSSLGFPISTTLVLGVVYSLTWLVVLLLMRSTRTTLKSIITELRKPDDLKGSFPYLIGYGLMLFLITRWYGQYPQFPGEVDGQAIAGLLNKISEYNSYTRFYEPKLDLFVGTYYPPVYLVFAAFIKNLFGWMPIPSMMIVTQFILVMIPLVAMGTVSILTSNPILIFVASIFAIPSGFYDHMNYAGSTDAMGLFAVSVTLFYLSRIGLIKSKINWTHSILVGLSLSMALLSNTVYFFYIMPGVALSLFLYLIYNLFSSQFKIFSLNYIGTPINVSIKLLVSILIAVLISLPVSRSITKNQEMVNGSYSTTKENMKVSNAPQLLYDRLTASSPSGGAHRNNFDIVIVLIGVILLLIRPQFASLVVFGSISYIFFHLSADWILNYLWCPEWIKKSFGLYLYGIDPSQPRVFLPFVYKYHGPFDFSWIALDSFLPFILVTLLVFIGKYWKPTIKKNRYIVIIPLIAATILLSSKLENLSDNTSFLKEEIYALWRGVLTVKPASISPELVSYFQTQTDPNNTLILVPKWEFSFSELPYANRWEFGWLGMLTGREIYEPRYLVFLNLKGITSNASSAIYEKYTEKSKKVSLLYKALYTEGPDKTPSGDYLRSGVTHAVTPAGLTSMVLKRRDDADLVYAQTGSCKDTGTCYDIIKFK